MQASLARATGVQGRLLRRVGDDGTWMEIYEAVPEPERFERELAAAVAAGRLEGLLSPGATRHVERFTTD
jgi:3-methyladenine DNA glycosylase/8-oxoguanine DNA glycosylase